MLNSLSKTQHIAILYNAIVLCFVSSFAAHATSVTLPYTFTAGSPISASQMMGNFSSITSVLSSTVSSPWVASSSNIYFATGSVGIGSSVPTYTLDVNGSVGVNGTTPLYTNGVAIGTTITGTFLSPTYAQSTSLSTYSLTVTPGTWLFTGAIVAYNTTGSGGQILVSIGPSSTNINQNNSRTIAFVGPGMTSTGSATFIATYSNTTAVYFVS